MTNTLDTLEMINHAARQSDRWLMVFMLAAVLACAYFAVKWLAGALERLEAKGAAERKELIEAYAKERTERFDILRKLQEESTTVIRENTEAYSRNHEVLDRVLSHLNTK